MARAICGFWLCPLIWRPEFDFAERRRARAWLAPRTQDDGATSTGHAPVPRPGVGMLSAAAAGAWCSACRSRMPARCWSTCGSEMPVAVYDPRWLTPHAAGRRRRWSSRSSRSSPSYTGELHPDEYCRIFAQASGSLWQHAMTMPTTLARLRQVGIHDQALARLP